jgi:hypothetical protein
LKVLENTVFFVHVPKTGGTSFRKGLELLFTPRRTYYDYGKDSKVTSDIILRNKYNDEDLYSLVYSQINHKKKSLISGHLDILDYAYLVKPENIITLFRDPVQRVISNYEHMKRNGSFIGTLEAFVLDGRFSNIQSKYLSGFPLEAIGFIGIMEFYDESMLLLEQQMSLPVQSLQLNVNKSDKKKYTVSEELLSIIQKENNNDLRLYDQAVLLFEKRRSFMLDRSCDIYGNVDSLNKNYISGWCYRRESEIFPETIEFFKNGKLIGSEKTKYLRPFFKHINAPRGGYVGFKYIFEDSLNESDSIVCKVKGCQWELQGLRSVTL